MKDVVEVLQQIHALLLQMQAQQLKQVFLLHCCAVTLGILWGCMTWALVCISKNERDFL